MKRADFVQILMAFSVFLVFQACKSEQNGKKSAPETPVNQVVNKYFNLAAPAQNSYIQPASELELSWEYTGQEVAFDSVQFILNGEVLKVTGPEIFTTSLFVPDIPPGQVNIRIVFYLGDGKTENQNLRVRVTSGTEPSNYTYRLVNTYPHDKKAFTQGLEYAGGFLYEGTGNYGESSLRKVSLETGEIVKFRNLPSDLFGEGITRINNKIYQITYREQVGFVYDENNFEVLRKIYYQIKEGWGLTNNGEHILMSDGSHIIYYMDTTYFSVVKKIEVFDNEKEVDLLNELELINGVLYANRYTTEEIVMIDPETGRLLGKINMSGILNPADRYPGIDYFNGIAYDSENDRIFVTGKYWPKVYEVKFVKTGIGIGN